MTTKEMETKIIEELKNVPEEKKIEVLNFIQGAKPKKPNRTLGLFEDIPDVMEKIVADAMKARELESTGTKGNE